MDTIKITKDMVDGLEKQKDSGYQKNFQPTVPIAVVIVDGESLRLKMDHFSTSGDVGNISFEVTDNDASIASGRAAFLLNREDIREIRFSSAVKEKDRIYRFVRKCILLLNEFNYIEWQNKVRRKSGAGRKHGSVQKAIRKYRISPQSEAAGLDLSSLTEKELLEMLRSEKKSFGAENEGSYAGKSPDGTAISENNADSGSNEMIMENTRSYVRHTAAWYVRGHYDRYGRYHQFHFAKSKIAVGTDYAGCRVPI